MLENPIFLIALFVGFLFSCLFYFVFFKKLKQPWSNAIWLPVTTALFTAGYWVYAVVVNTYGWQLLGAMIMSMLGAFMVLGYALGLILFYLISKK